MARAAKSESEHKLEGTKSKRKTLAVSKPRHIAPLSEDIPDYLPDSAATAYVEIVRDLNSLGVGASCDVAIVEALAMAVGTMRDCAAMLRADGLVLVDDRGVTRKHPCATLLNSQVAAIRQLAPQLGLSPTARAGMVINPPVAGDGDDPIMAAFGHYLED
jgi:P27 family predicted phage terminase small subunit